jgi:chromate reductase
MNILILSTSPRSGSLTFRASTYLKEAVKSVDPEEEVHLIDFAHFDISPFGKGSFPAEPPREFQTELLQHWKNAGMIIFCSPEYNWTASAETFILLERMGNRNFRDFFDNKVFAVVGVSSGRGGRQPALDISRVLSKIIGFLGTESIVLPKFLEIHEVGVNLDENAHSTGNGLFEESVQNFIRYSLKMAKRWISSS